MIVNKVTTGFVVQTFDTVTQRYTSQEFIAGDEVVVETCHGNPLDREEQDMVGIDNVYLPFEMKQPEEIK